MAMDRVNFEMLSIECLHPHSIGEVQQWIQTTLY